MSAQPRGPKNTEKTAKDTTCVYPPPTISQSGTKNETKQRCTNFFLLHTQRYTNLLADTQGMDKQK